MMVKCEIAYGGTQDERTILSNVNEARIQARCPEEADTLILQREARALRTEYYLDHSILPKWHKGVVIEETDEEPSQSVLKERIKAPTLFDLSKV